MRKAKVFIIGALAFGNVITFANNYTNPYFFYFSKGYRYGKCLNYAGSKNLKGWAVVIPVRNEVVFAYYHYLLSLKGLKPIAIKDAIVADVEKDKELLAKAINITKQLKLPYKIEQLSTTGYLFTVNCKAKVSTPSPKSNTAKKKSLKPNNNSTTQKKVNKLPIDRVIADLEKALKDAQNIGKVEPKGIRTIYQIEFDKDKLIKDLQEIIKGLKEFKKETGLNLQLD